MRREVYLMRMSTRKFFKHGGSYAIDIPIAFVKHADSNEVIIEENDNELIVRAKTELDTIESEPQFATFVSALVADAMKHPEKLKDVKAVWDKEWDDLLKDVSDDSE